MGIRKLKPTTPGQTQSYCVFDKSLQVHQRSSVGKKSTGGRNNTGKMTMRYIGGVTKQKYRIIDFKRNKDGIPATVKSNEYDPNRSSRIACCICGRSKRAISSLRTDWKLAKQWFSR